MKKLGDFGSKDVAIERAQALIDQHYVVVVTVSPFVFGQSPRYEVWATKETTVMTGGWNR